MSHMGDAEQQHKVLVYSQYDPYLIPVQKVSAEHMLEIQTEGKMVWVIQ